jgi:hypothetical protein
MTKTNCPVYWNRKIEAHHILYADIRYQAPSNLLKAIPEDKDDEFPEIIYLNDAQMNSASLVSDLLDLGFEKVYEFTNQKTNNQVGVFKRE